MASLADLKAKLEEKRGILHDFMAQAGPEVDLDRVSIIQGSQEDKQREFRMLNDEVSALGKEVDRLTTLQALGRANDLEIMRQAGGGNPPVAPGELINRTGDRPTSSADLRRALAESKGFRDFKARGFTGAVTIDLPGLSARNLITLADISPQPDRGPFSPIGLEMRTISDLLVQGTTTSNMTEYYQQLTLGDAAQETVEGDDAPADSWTTELEQDPVRDITDFIDMTMDALNDVNELESELRGSLMYSVQHRKDRQILRGDGAGVNLKGIMNRSLIQTQAVAAEASPNAIYKGMQKVRGSAGAGFAEPTAIVMHPQNWTAIRLLQTSNGIYLYGSPNDPGAERLWGLEVRQHTAMPVGTALTGAFTPFATLMTREGMSVMLSTEHEDYFRKRKVAVLAVERCALKVTRPSAFCTITGLLGV